MPPPITPRHPVDIEQLGRTRTDEYGWLKDPNWQAVLRDPAVLRSDIRDHLLAENAHTEAVLADTAALQQTLFDEMVGRIEADDSTVPAPDGPWAYYRRYAAGAQHSLLVRAPAAAQGDGGVEQVLLDVDAMAEPHAYFRLGGAEHSADHRRFAWAEDRQGSEVYTVHVIDLDTRAPLGAPIENCTGNFVFSPCGGHLFWTLRDDNGRPSAVLRRPVGGGPADDVPVLGGIDPGFFLSVGVASSRQWIVLSLGNQDTSEAWVVPSDAPTAPARLVAAAEPGVRYEIDHWGDRFVLRTNADGALDYKLVTASAADLSRAGWHDLVPYRPGQFITGFALFAGHLVHVERVNALDRIVVTGRAAGESRPLVVEEEAYCLSVVGGYEYDTTVLRYAYESPREPRQVLDYDMATGERVLRKAQQIPSGHNPAAYVVRRLQATAPDGATVPITLLARRDAFAAGACPVLLYGYGAYGLSSMPRFSLQTLNLVERGWIWATAHVRGGSEKGWGWFLDGRGPAKPNTFKDFVACADHLVTAGHATAGKIVAYGGSAGGLLVGAVLNMRPELWAGVAAAVPFVDVLNTMSDTTLPLTPPEWPEWGNPLTDPAAYDTIAGYSPYDQVAARPYPPVLALGGLSDPRVTYWEPAKWIAKLRAHTTGPAPMLLRMNMTAGHGGRSGRYDHLREPALVHAFALWAMAQAGPPLRDVPTGLQPGGPVPGAARPPRDIAGATTHHEQERTMADTNTTTAIYLTGLRNQHAVETQAIGTIQNELPRTKSYPELHAKMQEDKERSTEQAARLDRLLSKHGASASLAKEAATGAVATVAGFMHAFASDEVLKDVLAAVGYKAYEIGSYKVLIALAGMAGATDDVPVLEQSMKEEQEMGDWLGSHLPNFVSTYVMQQKTA